MSEIDGKNMILVGLGNKMSSGKDTIADILVKEHGFMKLSFAQPLKRLVYHSVPGVREVVDELGWDGAKKIPWIRKCLQDTGTNARNFLATDVWIKVADTWILQDLKERNLNGAAIAKYVISDVRFNNEADWIRSRGGIVVRVERPNIRSEISEAEDHDSENGLSGKWYDWIINNSGGMEDLYKAAESLNRYVETTHAD